ncbi:methionine aminopeptidase [Candidatus Carsonella ruddii CS isolate Thao2000]|uniref:Methionine aminopeptidase n=1 Tax=Candidatus Carsonella ruddii CS isolate Thao2000 TaxID=1202537 RepID=J7GSG3_CARRU|nr:methionine aminopeptidase [Candidatus Carsonella ruddii]AFP83682.1 methionine aminopeptidase [Candidatus Carsonella ruddii CS isolate Thao2000]
MKKFIKIGFINNVIITIICNYINNISLGEIDFLLFFYIKIFNCKSSTMNFKKYKFCSCLSINYIICHGIPIFYFKKYNFIKIDVCIKKIFYSDCCYTSKNIFNIFFKFFFFYLIKNLNNKSYSYISFLLNKNKFNKINLIKNYCSHGIFKKMHTNMIIKHNKNYFKKKIKNFDTFTLEPMFCYGKSKNLHYKKIFLSKKKFYSFQWEHTLFNFNNKFIITTLRKNELCM